MSDIVGYLDGQRDERERGEARAAQLRAELDQSRAEKRDLQDEIERLRAREVSHQIRWEELKGARAEIERLRAWVSDLQSSMYVNCVYCGRRYGPGETTPVSMADALKAHVEKCPEHPMSALKNENERLRALVKTLADDLADEIEGHYQGLKNHPSVRSRYERDMANVYEARRALEQAR